MPCTSKSTCLIIAIWLTAFMASVHAADETKSNEPPAKNSHRMAAAKLMQAEKFPEALAELDLAIAAAPKDVNLYVARGDMNFRVGKFKESVADYDKQIELAPESAAGHWMRGISCYYAGQYDEGAKQFAAYHTKVDDNDVENSVWRCMCVTKKIGVEKARADMLVVKNDRRVPMMEAYRMFRGEVDPADVLKAAEAGKVSDAELNHQRFYANLYVGLYYDSLGKTDEAMNYLKVAVDHPIGHYMWTVAKVHADLLAKKPEGK
jgi:lipoprotein NlpI